MRTRLLLPVLFVAVFCSCKATQPTTPTTGNAAMITDVGRALDTTSRIFYRFADSTHGNPWQAIMRTADWLRTQPNVQSVETLDSIYIRVTIKSGLQGIFHFDELDANGNTIFRGGSSHPDASPEVAPMPAGPSVDLPKILSSNTITNKKVLIFSPAFSEFYSKNNEMDKVTQLLQDSPLGLDVTLYKNAECAFDIVNAFSDYGLVILDTHGMPDAFMVGGVDTVTDTTAWIQGGEEDYFKQIASSHAGKDSYNQILAGDITIEMSVKANPSAGQWFGAPHNYHFITFMLKAKYLETTPKLTNTVVFGNMCYSGFNATGHFSPYFVDNPIRAEFLALSPISYYAYAYGDPDADKSRTVTDHFAHVMEDSLLTRLVTNRDSTGQASLKVDGTEYFDPYADTKLKKLYLHHYGADDYAYVSCRDTLLDARDGQKYPTICIGKQIWMAKNLNYPASGSMCFDSTASNCDQYGMLYTFDGLLQGAAPTNAIPSGVQGPCPNGWHVPSAAEWGLMISNVPAGGGGLKDTIGWNSPNTGATNSTGFTALAAGYRGGAGFTGLGKTILFGSTTYTSNFAQLFGLNYYDGSLSPTVGGNQGEHTNASYCRCVKNP